jgi:hypothetical protein
VNLFRKLAYAISVTAVVVVLVVGLSAGGSNAQTETTKPVPQTDPVKLAPTVQPPETTAKEPPPPTYRVVSMAEAVTIAEKSVKGGYTTRAERTERPVIGFRVEVVGMDGAKSVLELSGDGKKVKKSNQPWDAIPVKKKGGRGG